jgi:hypothetical protein
MVSGIRPENNKEVGLTTGGHQQEFLPCTLPRPAPRNQRPRDIILW